MKGTVPQTLPGSKDLRALTLAVALEELFRKLAGGQFPGFFVAAFFCPIHVSTNPSGMRHRRERHDP